MFLRRFSPSTAIFLISGSSLGRRSVVDPLPCVRRALGTGRVVPPWERGVYSDETVDEDVVFRQVKEDLGHLLQ